MKLKFVLLFLAVICLNSCMSLYSGPSGEVVENVDLISNHPENRKNAIELDCYASSYDGSFITVYLRNRTQERVYVEWENARCQYDRVIFGDDRRITMGNPKADEAISPMSSSLRREVTGQGRIMSDYILPLYKVKDLKNGEKETVSLKIPIRFADGSVEEYLFHINLSWKVKEVVE